MDVRRLPHPQDDCRGNRILNINRLGPSDRTMGSIVAILTLILMTLSVLPSCAEDEVPQYEDFPIDPATLVGALLGAVIGLSIACAVEAVLLRAAAKSVIKETITFGKAFKIIFCVNCIYVAAGVVIGIVVSIITESEVVFNILGNLMWVAAILIQSTVIAAKLRTSIGDAILITLWMVGVFLGIMIILSLIVFAIEQVFNVIL